MLTFGAPQMSVLFLLLPVVLLLLWWGARTRRHRLAAWADEPTAVRLAQGVAPWRRRLRAGLLVAAIAACAGALLRPRWGFHYEEVKRRGIDLVLVVDVSESMLAADVSPSRLERAKREIADFLQLVEGDRIALVAAAGTSFVQCPLTLDYGALREFLTLVDTDLIPTPGTDLAGALRTAADALEPSGPSRGKAIVLISDGGNLTGNPAQVAATLHDERNFTLYTVGIGDPEQAVPIRLADGSLKEFEGRVVTTRLEEDTLKDVARAGGGVYVRAVTGDLDLENIYTDIRERHTTAELGHAKRKVYHERFVWPLGFGLLCLALEACISERGRRVAATAAASLVLAPTSVWADVSGQAARGISAYEAEDYTSALQAFSEAHDTNAGDPRTAFNRAAAEYQTGDYAAALEHFEAAASAADPTLRAHTWYNAGNAYAQLRRFDEALDAYERALRIDPSDGDAKANLELVRRLIQQREEEQQQRQQEKAQRRQQEQHQQPESDSGQPQGAERPREQPAPSQEPPAPQQDPAGAGNSQPQEPSQPRQQQQPADATEGSHQPRDDEAPHPAGGQPGGEPGDDVQGMEQHLPAQPGRMSRAEAERWLQQLPSEDAKALKAFWRNRQPRPNGPPRRDW